MSTMAHQHYPSDLGLPISQSTWQTLADRLQLSARELEIVQGIVCEQSETDIAVGLGISPHTVHSYLIRLYRKLGVDCRCGLVVRIFRSYLDVEGKISL